MSECMLPLERSQDSSLPDLRVSITVSVPSKSYAVANQRQVALKERGIDKLLEEAREDNKENDAIHLSRK